MRTAVTIVLVWICGVVLAGGVRADPEWAAAVFPSGATFSLEIAADEVSRTRGYMFRERVGPNEGMLFLFEASGRHAIWMRNCRVALDIIWLDGDYRVVDIAPNRQPCADDEPCPSVFPMQPSRYVLEVAAGAAAREGLQRGDRIDIVQPAESP